MSSVLQLTRTGPNAESDIADQVNMLNNAINKNPDGIALAACDQNSVLDSLQSALDNARFRLYVLIQVFWMLQKDLYTQQL